ncbi:hypothetical protein ACF0H5_022240 [Mactra antiquata]
MIDAMGKPSSDIANVHLTWLGSWEECVNVEGVTNGTDGVDSEHVFKGKYCLVAFPIKLDGVQTSINTGMCFPDTCSDVNCWSLTYTLLKLLPLSTPMYPNILVCQETSLELSDKAVAVTVVCSIFAFIIVMATAYDVLIRSFLSNRVSSVVTPVMNGTPYGTAVANGTKNEHVVSETTTLIAEDSFQRNMVSHHENDVRKIQNGSAHSPSQNTENKPNNYTPGMLGKILLSFSVITNASKLLNTNQPSSTLTNINGVRFISMTWVILGHTYVFSLRNGDNTVEFLGHMYKRFSFQAIENETVAVDTFFVLSGLLVAYLSLREMKKRGGPTKFNWLMFYFHRFWRLTPPYMLLLMLYVPTFKYWGDGPVWPQKGIEVDECKDSWWTNLLYVNNLVRTDKMCMGWSWYLANDMQFYILSPLLLVPLFYSPIFGGIMCLAFVLVNFITTGVISHDNELSSNLMFGAPGEDGFDKIYIKPWTRVGPYAVGIFTGYILYKVDGKFKMPKIINLIGWLFATAMAMLVLYGLYSSTGVPSLGVKTSAFYNATSRTAWGIAVAWVVFACAVGYGGPINTLLSWKGIIPLSRLTYCAYLVHPLVIYVYYYSRRTMFHFYDLEMIYLFLGNLCLSYMAAFVISMAFEAPMMGLEKVLLRREKNS